MNAAATLDRDAVARRAYELYLVRGGNDGHDVEDWLRAERELAEAAPGNHAGGNQSV